MASACIDRISEEYGHGLLQPSASAAFSPINPQFMQKGVSDSPLSTSPAVTFGEKPSECVLSPQCYFCSLSNAVNGNDLSFTFPSPFSEVFPSLVLLRFASTSV